MHYDPNDWGHDEITARPFSVVTRVFEVAIVIILVLLLALAVLFL